MLQVDHPSDYLNVLTGPSYQYIIDVYESYAASALASITLIRYVAAGGMTVVGIPFYKNLGGMSASSNSFDLQQTDSRSSTLYPHHSGVFECPPSAGAIRLL